MTILTLRSFPLLVQRSKPLQSQRQKPPTHSKKFSIQIHSTSNPLAQDKELAKFAEKRQQRPKKTIVRTQSTSLVTEDIAGSKPKAFKSIRRSYSALGNDDIVGSKPNYAKKFDKKPQVY